jgi:hypothetical protein
LTQVLESLKEELGIGASGQDGNGHGSSASGALHGESVANGGAKSGEAKSGEAKKGKGKAAAAAAAVAARSPKESVVDDSAFVDKEQSWIQCDQCEKWRRVPW